ncbi:MAG: hypothetical protein IPN14_08500 [Bacteroidetes bacterium]|nr:hypothetical protein [Bacteroidota bacterium]
MKVTGLSSVTEADTISNVMKQDWGGYSDIRKSFHHEPISTVVKRDREYYEIKSPKPFMLITEYSSQITGLVKVPVTVCSVDSYFTL